jgi:hypothetical protein
MLEVDIIQYNPPEIGGIEVFYRMVKDLARRLSGAQNQKHFIRKTRQDDAVGDW